MIYKIIYWVYKDKPIIILLLTFSLSVTYQNNVLSQNSYLPIPSLISPPNNASDVYPSVKFVWSSSEGAQYYHLKVWQFRTEFNFSDSTLTDTTYQLDGLKFNNSYNWQVRAISELAASDFSTRWGFKTQPNDAPKIVVPLKARNSRNDTMTLHFGVAVKATCCIDEEFGEFELPPLPPCYTCFHVAFVDSRFGDGRCLGVGTLLNLQGWEKTVKKDTFRIRYQTGTEDEIIIFSWPSGLNEYYDSLMLRPIYPITFIDMLKDTICIINQPDLNTIRIFGIPKPYGIPDPPVLIYPLDDVVTYDSVRIDWKQTLRAYKYWLQISSDSNFTNLIVNDSTIKTTSYTIKSGLEPNINYYWRVGAINSEGFGGFSGYRKFIFLTTSKNEEHLIENYFLSQNYPNPINSSGIIEYGLPKETFVIIKIYNLLGQEIKTLVHSKQKAGVYKVNLNLQQYPSGIYYYRMQAENFTQTRKILLLR